MKLISLNICGGAAYEPLMKFVNEQSSTTDIFCFQEIFKSSAHAIIGRYGERSDIFKDVSAILSDRHAYFAPMIEHLRFGKNLTDVTATLGQASFVRRNVAVPAESKTLLYRGDNPTSGSHIGNAQCLHIAHGGRSYTIVNVYGMAAPGNKLDTPERLKQSERLLNFINAGQGKKIICGDFNLLPNTESIKVLEKSLRNLIRDYGIKTTRSVLNYAKYPEPNRQYFADYVFVSPDVNVISFDVPELAISDHLPMIIEFD